MVIRKLPFLLSLALVVTANAQRFADNLDRGLVAVKTSSGIFCSWRITGDEYYDTQYNIYRDGKRLNTAPLNTSNYTDAKGSADSHYTVEAVVRGQAQPASSSVKPWKGNFLDIKLNHGKLKSRYVPNDACAADVDGDGEMELLLKFDNRNDVESGFKPEGNEGEYAIMEVYKLNGKKLWWMELGPNMTDFQNNENNIVAYDWDMDGKAEALLRAADGTVLHTADGKEIAVGDKSKNYREPNGAKGPFFIHEGAEFLLYLDGTTGKPFQIMDYPLPRLEKGETDLKKAWGDGYGHRSSKHFFGAPYLDGRHPSIFLARGIYTRHKMVAFDVDPSTHRLKERWRWSNNTPGSPWYGQGYHNFGIADVDVDGRDEIVFGSMVIDDTGKGLSTTGLGHGDAQHCGDLDPYTPGLEIFACNEDNPNNNFRDATTSRIYYRTTGQKDDGRAIAGKFIDEIPGGQAMSSRDPNVIGLASHRAIDGESKKYIAQNFRIYWDGDLCEETFNYKNGQNTEGCILKARHGEIAVLKGSLTNNSTKGTPCLQADLFGDWREEVVMRTPDDNVRIFTTNIETPWRNYTLWHDHQYRNAVVWQMCGYNQPPHASYYLGQAEGITTSPPPLITKGRKLIANHSEIGSEANGKHVMMCDNGDMTVEVGKGCSPYTFTDNAPTWVQGHDGNPITTTTYTHTLKGSPFTGQMRLVKQGSGILVLPDRVQTYSGSTDVWEGTLRFDGTLKNSQLWLNRHTTLITDGGSFDHGIRAKYNATIQIGKDDEPGKLYADSLNLGFGSRVMFDLFEGKDGKSASDFVKAGVLAIERKDWSNGPKYSAPIFQFRAHTQRGKDKLDAGKYLIGRISKIDGNIDDVIIEGLDDYPTHKLSIEGEKLYLNVKPGES